MITPTSWVHAGTTWSLQSPKSDQGTHKPSSHQPTHPTCSTSMYKDTKCKITKIYCSRSLGYSLLQFKKKVQSETAIHISAKAVPLVSEEISFSNTDLVSSDLWRPTFIKILLLKCRSFHDSDLPHVRQSTFVSFELWKRSA